MYYKNDLAQFAAVLLAFQFAGTVGKRAVIRRKLNSLLVDE